MEFTQRQIEIIEAVKKLIGEKGIQNITTKKLANEMGFTEAALYRHFKNKNEILNSVLIYYREKRKKILAPIVANNETGLEKLKTIFKSQFSYFSQHPGIVMVIFSETSFQHEKLLSDTVLSILNEKRTMLEKVIKMGQKDGTIKADINYKQLAIILMGSMRMTILKWRLSNFDFNLVREGVKVWAAIKSLIDDENH